MFQGTLLTHATKYKKATLECKYDYDDLHTPRSDARTQVRTQAAEAISLYKTVRSSKSSDDKALERDVKDVFKDLADATTDLRSVLATFPHARDLKGTAKKVMSRSKVGLKAFTSTFKFVHKHIHVKRHDEGIQFILDVPSDPSSKASSSSPSTEVDITDLVVVCSVCVCRCVWFT